MPGAPAAHAALGLSGSRVQSLGSRGGNLSPFFSAGF